ncbi:hypothetical protein PR003_g33475 [Phytophthora rubi]|uniref:Uncharacterized protein n=1 Tax=Phytophthora rubi TaxID=129364 RepID=A0A6A4AR78_9STRA|nr:hypothetical protein PR003_g33475 [Phytophthora rubi]
MTWEQAANSVSSTPARTAAPHLQAVGVVAGVEQATVLTEGGAVAAMGVDVVEVATEVEAVVLAEMVQPLLLHHPPELMVPTERPPRGSVALASSASRRSIKCGSARISGQAKPPSFSKRCVHDGSPPLRRACAVCK